MTTANTKLNVLVACESSGTVRDAFRKRGHNAWSCDLLPCDTDPSYHVQGDVLALLQGKVKGMVLQGGCSGGGPSVKEYSPSKWDLMIAHPPCTYLCNSGVRWLYEWLPAAPGQGRASAAQGRASAARAPSGVHLSNVPPYEPVEFQFRNEARWKQMREAGKFFHALWNADVPHVAVENPIMSKWGRSEAGGRRQTQLIQPYQFGHPESKATCLWLRGLPKLLPTKIVPATNGSAMWKLPPSKDRWKLRSKTYQGFADAMARQWSAHLLNQ